MFKYLLLSICISLILIVAYLGIFSSHQGYLNQFCEENARDISLKILERKISQLSLVKSEIIKGQYIDDVWFQPRLTVKSIFVPEIFGCQILLSSAENENVLFVSGGYNVTEIESPSGIFTLVYNIVN